MEPGSFLELDRVGLLSIAFLLAVAALGSALAARVYLAARDRAPTGIGVSRAAPIIGVALAAVLITVQFSLPLSLGLLAALTLVRLRTPIKEPEEIALIMLITAAAVSVASLKLGFLGALLLAGLVAALCTRHIARMASAPGFTQVTIQLPRASAVEALRALDCAAGTFGQAAMLEAISSDSTGLRLACRLPRLSTDRRDALLAGLTSTLASARVEVTDVVLSRPDTDA